MFINVKLMGDYEIIFAYISRDIFILFILMAACWGSYHNVVDELWEFLQWQKL